MAIKLSDDGTMDTVLCCDQCGEEFRFNYDGGMDSGNDDDQADREQAAVDAYDDWIEECIAEIEAEHDCNADNDDDDEPSEPQDDDLTTEDHRTFYQDGRMVLEPYDDREDEPTRWIARLSAGRQQTIVTPAGNYRMALRLYMELSQWFPSVWWISDHGNAHRILDIHDPTKD